MKYIIKNKSILFIMTIILVLGFLYFSGKGTFTSFESLIFGNSNIETSGIKVRLNGVDVASNSQILDSNFFMDNIIWSSTHTREGKMSPGSSGTFQIELDPSGSEVSIIYEFSFIDKAVDSNKLLNFDKIVVNDGSVVKTSADTYSGIMSLDDIKNGKKVTFNVDFYFDWVEDIEGITDNEDVYEDLFEINFQALQYNGEELVPYIE